MLGYIAVEWIKEYACALLIIKFRTSCKFLLAHSLPACYSISGFSWQTDLRKRQLYSEVAFSFPPLKHNAKPSLGFMIFGKNQTLLSFRSSPPCPPSLVKIFAVKLRATLRARERVSISFSFQNSLPTYSKYTIMQPWCGPHSHEVWRPLNFQI